MESSIMRIAITGHKTGIGKFLLESFTQEGHEVIGFGRSNGYNIKDKDSRNKIITESKNCDVFINNAYNYEDWDNSQLDMLKEIYSDWMSNKDKCIINLSSSAADIYPTPVTVPGVPRYPDYVKAKWEQDRWLLSVRNFLNVREQVRLVNLKPGRILTEKTYDKWKDDRVLKTSDVYKIVRMVLEEKDIEFSTVTFKAF